MTSRGKKAPIFVVGAFRSGTTMLRLMLNMHSHIGIPPETHFIPELVAQCGHSASAEEFLHCLREQRNFASLGLDQEDLARRLQPATGLAAQIEVVFRMWAEQRGKIRWGDKTPCYVRRLEEIGALYPQMQVIHIIRDGRDVAASLVRMPWFHGGVVKAARRWKKRVQRGMRSGRILGAEQYFEIRYEELVTDPESSLRAISRFLQEGFEGAMLEFHTEARQQIPDDQQSFHGQASRPVHRGRIGRWREVLSAAETKAIEDVAGSQLEALGYSLSTQGVMPSSWRRVRWIGRDLKPRVDSSAQET